MQKSDAIIERISSSEITMGEALKKIDKFISKTERLSQNNLALLEITKDQYSEEIMEKLKIIRDSLEEYEIMHRSNNEDMLVVGEESESANMEIPKRKKKKKESIV